MHGDRLGRDAAGPEDRHLAGADLRPRRRSRAGRCRGCRWPRVAEVDRRAVGPGKRAQICDGLDGLLAASCGRIDTTIGPWKTPAGRQAMLVRYIGTLRPISMCRTGSPACSRAFSNVNEQPSRKPTRSSRHHACRSVGSSISSPC